MKLTILLLLILALLPLIQGEALLVTVQYDSGTLSIRHAELINAPEPAVTNDGSLALAYIQNGNPTAATRFYLPILANTPQGPQLDSHVEHTLLIPWQPGAQQLALYEGDGIQVATFDLSGIQNAGDASGQPPTDSRAFALNEVSVSKAVLAPSASGTRSSPSSPSGNQSPKLCGSTLLLPLAGLLIFLLARGGRGAAHLASASPI